MIEFRHLRYFVAVAEELNFRRAAERIHIDQTPLSRTVRDLEGQLGVLLFVRAPRSLRLTPAGTRLLDEARKIFLRVERTKRVVRETDLRYRAPLRIGVADDIAQPKLVECFARWRELVPETALELSEMRAAELLAALRRDEVDVGFSFGVADDDAIEQERAWSYPLTALVPVGHELASFRAVSLADVVAFPMIVCHPDHEPGMRQQTDAIVRKSTTALVIAGKANSLAGLITRIGAGLGVSGQRCHLDAKWAREGASTATVDPLPRDASQKLRLSSYAVTKNVPHAPSPKLCEPSPGQRSQASPRTHVCCQRLSHR
jgi:DNA-binding transcriptional LysR family regulator